MNKLFLLLIAILFALPSKAQTDTLGTLFRSAYKVYELQRHPSNGLYRDSKVFSGNDFHPCSVANVGIGLISLCVADSMGWENNAEQLALTTLKTITGNTSGVLLDRSPSGFFRHFVDMNTGVRAWNSEYSTIDTGIMVCGAMFCKKYFSQNDSIAKYADILWNSIDWSRVVANENTGRLYMIIDDNGNGLSSSTLPPFNEYMIVAWLAMKAENGNGGAATNLWNNHFAHADSLPTNTYQSIPVLTDHPSSYIPSFTLQFPYYMCHPFTVQADYNLHLDNARLADQLWFSLQTTAKDYEWGLGAGSYPITGYHADEINENSQKVVSPHIIAGFYPVHSKSEQDLLALYRNQKGIYTLPTAPPNKIIWRYSLSDPNWVAPEVQGIDYASMLFGLASMPQFLGKDFFKRNNDYDFPSTVGTKIVEVKEKKTITIRPNPIKDTLHATISHSYRGRITVSVYDESGIVRSSALLDKNLENFDFSLQLNKLPTGIYFLEWQSDDFNRQAVKFIKQ